MTPFHPSRSIKVTKDYSSYTISILRRWLHGKELGVSTQNPDPALHNPSVRNGMADTFHSESKFWSERKKIRL